jgi:hypothetical protein
MVASQSGATEGLARFALDVPDFRGPPLMCSYDRWVEGSCHGSSLHVEL